MLCTPTSSPPPIPNGLTISSTSPAGSTQRPTPNSRVHGNDHRALLSCYNCLPTPKTRHPPDPAIDDLHQRPTLAPRVTRSLVQVAANVSSIPPGIGPRWATSVRRGFSRGLEFRADSSVSATFFLAKVNVSDSALVTSHSSRRAASSVSPRCNLPGKKP